MGSFVPLTIIVWHRPFTCEFRCSTSRFISIKSFLFCLTSPSSASWIRLILSNVFFASSTLAYNGSGRLEIDSVHT